MIMHASPGGDLPGGDSALEQDPFAWKRQSDERSQANSASET